LWQLSATVLMLGMLNVALASDGQLLWVSNHGVDSPSCGNTTGTACRSISQAIENATDGDTLMVLPGQYGDLNADGDLDDPGEEHFDPGADEFSTCFVCIHKRLRIFSKYGAAVTIINASKIKNAIFPTQTAVQIFANGVVFGAPNHGFTISGPNDFGLIVRAGNVQVAGNIITDGEYRLEPRNGSLLVSDNLAVRGGFLLGEGNVGGFVLYTPPDSKVTRVVLQNNTAVGTPIFIDFESGTDLQVLGNVVTNVDVRGGFGFWINGTSGPLSIRLLVKNNTAISNGIGFFFPQSLDHLTIVRNSAIGNRGPGMIVGPPDGEGSIDIHENNIYGNDTNGTDSIFPPYEGRNCGLLNVGGRPKDPLINASNNYWGSSKGPGPDPADNTGVDAGCDSSNRIVFKPFARASFPIGPH
jgi:hypothetical protein